VPSIAPSGKAFYTGDKFARWKGDLFIGALRDQMLVRLKLDGEKVVRNIRALDTPLPILVGGQSADLLDGKAGMFSRLPLAIGIIAGITFVVLFLSFGSILMPLKAIVLNLLSLTATFGAMVWIFQEGHLSGLLNFTATGTLVGTPYYMAPEQHEGVPADTRADVYAFCVSLFEAVYGERPFEAPHPTGLALRKLAICDRQHA
jgi:serine/threonine protein kinase